MPSGRTSFTPLVPAMVAALAGTAAAAPPLPFPAVLELASLSGGTGFVINGIDTFDYSGMSVSSAGDINGDGIDDLIIGARLASPNGQAEAGESYVVFGKDTGFAASLNLSTLSGANGFVINGIDAGDRSGSSVSSAGDVNGDGIDDLIVGAYGAAPNGQGFAGESYVVFGKDTAVDGPFAAFINLSALNGTNGFVLNGINAGDYAGASVSSAGDVNGDGIDDVIVGALHASPNGQSHAGESYVVFGRDTAVDGPFAPSLSLSALDGTNGFVCTGSGDSDHSGTSVSSAGDVNGDGIDDLIIGAYTADSSGQPLYAGESYVVFGKDTAVDGPFAPSLSLSTLDGTNGFSLIGIDSSDQSGYSVSSAGDVNGDGTSDLIIGARLAAPNGQPYAGESYVVFGKDTAVDGPFAPYLDLSTLNGANGFTINGIDSADFSGYSVSSAGDVNGDGTGDVIIGAPSGDPNGQGSAGESYVVFGKDTAVDGSFAPYLDLSTLNGATGFRINGIDAGDSSGVSVSSAGDIDGDGAGDLLIGASGGDPNGQPNAGECYIVYGRAPIPCTGDVNGDGVVNVSDFNILATHFFQPVAPGTNGDLTGNGFVNVSDFNIVASYFGCVP